MLTLIYLVILYFLNDAFSTFYNAALTALNARRTTNNLERGYIAAIESILGSSVGACGTYIAALLPFLLPNVSEAERYFYSYSPMAGLGHFIHTYECDGNPIPSFYGEPEKVALPNTAEELAEIVYCV